MRELRKVSKNIHNIVFDKKLKVLLISDPHWDNPKCDRDLLKKDLDKAVQENAIICINGDLFCLMQGKGDPRRSKDDIRPEHNNGKYLDSIVETAAEWFTPYAHNIAVIGYGNHETGIIKHQETDILQRFVDLLNYKTGANVQTGGYGGVLNFQGYREHGGNPSFSMYYYHGHGGGGIVTKGVIQDQRIMSSVEGFDCTWQGHVHELYHHVNMVAYFDRNQKKISHRAVHQLRTSTYKEEYGQGDCGFHVERGRPPKPLGGYWLELKTEITPNKVHYLVPKFYTT